MSNWQEIETLIPVFKRTFEEVLDFEKFNMIAMTFHSTAIEGSTLTLTESELLLDKGLTPKAKPLAHQNMVLDHHAALLHILEMAEKKTPVTVRFIQDTAARVMKNTGSTYNTALGAYDVSKGEIRLHNVRAGNQYFVNYDKVKDLLDTLVTKLLQRIGQVQTIPEILKLSFDAHFDLVTIHPFGDGNGRTSRLLMNYIQHYHQLPIAPVFLEDRNEYINALMNSREEKSMEPFYAFMAGQYLKYLKTELSTYQSQLENPERKKDRSSGKGYSLVF